MSRNKVARKGSGGMSGFEDAVLVKSTKFRLWDVRLGPDLNSILRSGAANSGGMGVLGLVEDVGNTYKSGRCVRFACLLI